MFLVKKPPKNVYVLGFGPSEDYLCLDSMSHCGKSCGAEVGAHLDVFGGKMLSGSGSLTMPTLSLPRPSSVSESLRRVLVHSREMTLQADL